MTHLALGSSIACYSALAPSLYTNRRRRLAVRVACDGFPRQGGQRGDRIDCSGRATVDFDFDEAEKCEGVAYRLEEYRTAFISGAKDLADDPPQDMMTAMLYLDKVVE